MAPKTWTSWESHLVTRAQSGEKVAFELLSDLYRENLRHQAMRVLKNSDDAYDAVQDTFYKAYRSIHRFRPGKPVLPWLSRICANCCIDILRQRKQNTEPIDKFEYTLSCPNSGVDSIADFESEQVRESVNRLPKHYREIVLMRHFKMMEVAEIAQAVNKPEGTVKSWLFRARGLMKRDLEQVLTA